jgi:hypothetical protein
VCTVQFSEEETIITLSSINRTVFVMGTSVFPVKKELN